MFKYTSQHPIYNANPPDGRPRHGNWKTIQGFKYEAKKLAHCIFANEKLQTRNYTWHVTVNINTVLSDDEHKSVWKEATRQLRQHITAVYIREPDTDNHVNYHLLLNTEISHQRLKECLELAFHQVDNTLTIAPVYSTFALARYMTKADDRYKDKQLIFAPYCTLNKHGTIGPFWNKPPKQIWAMKIEMERKISVALNEGYNSIQPAAKYLHHCVSGYIPFRRIRRNITILYAADKQAVETLASCWQPEYIDGS